MVGELDVDVTCVVVAVLDVADPVCVGSNDCATAAGNGMRQIVIVTEANPTVRKMSWCL